MLVLVFEMLLALRIIISICLNIINGISTRINNSNIINTAINHMANRIHCYPYNFGIATLLSLLFASCSVCPCYVFASACVCVCHLRVFESCSVVLCSSCWCQSGSNTLSPLLVRVGWLALALDDPRHGVDGRFFKRPREALR